MMLLTEGEEAEGQRESGVRLMPFNLTHSPLPAGLWKRTDFVNKTVKLGL